MTWTNLNWHELNVRQALSIFLCYLNLLLQLIALICLIIGFFFRANPDKTPPTDSKRKPTVNQAVGGWISYVKFCKFGNIRSVVLSSDAAVDSWFSKGGANLLFGQHLPKTASKMKENWPGACAAKIYSVDPPLWCTVGCTPEILLKSWNFAMMKKWQFWATGEISVPKVLEFCKYNFSFDDNACGFSACMFYCGYCNVCKTSTPRWYFRKYYTYFAW